MAGLQAELHRHSSCIADIQESMAVAGRASANLREQVEQSRTAEELLKKLAGDSSLMTFDIILYQSINKGCKH